MPETLLRPQTERATVRCAVYTCKSHEDGLEQEFNSLDAQRDACEAFIRSQASRGWELAPGQYDDGGFSGGTMERPALKRPLKDIEAGQGGIIVSAFNYSGSQSNERDAFAWYGSATSPGNPAMTDWWAEINWLLATFGAPVSTAGDVDGDGSSDVIINAPVYAYNYIAEGGASVCHIRTRP